MLLCQVKTIVGIALMSNWALRFHWTNGEFSSLPEDFNFPPRGPSSSYPNPVFKILCEYLVCHPSDIRVPAEPCNQLFVEFH